mmetsp:Transcript_11475/g.13167  ORF Transcript_11475/g.13167 Transcript_11475/m.13167 type:complete len:80 (+) Transcript_11475:3158-3397(+)
MVSGIVAVEHAKGLFGENYTKPGQKDNVYLAFPAEMLKEKIETADAMERGDIVYVEDMKLFRSSMELYPSFVDMFIAGV